MRVETSTNSPPFFRNAARQASIAGQRFSVRGER